MLVKGSEGVTQNRSEGKCGRVDIGAPEPPWRQICHVVAGKGNPEVQSAPTWLAYHDIVEFYSHVSFYRRQHHNHSLLNGGSPDNPLNTPTTIPTMMSKRQETAKAAPSSPTFVRTEDEHQSTHDATVFFVEADDTSYMFLGWTSDTDDSERPNVYYRCYGKKNNSTRSRHQSWDVENQRFLETTFTQVDAWDEHVDLPNTLKCVLEKKYAGGFPNNALKLQLQRPTEPSKRKYQTSRNLEDCDAADEVDAKRQRTREPSSVSQTPGNNEPAIERSPPSMSLNDTLERTTEARRQLDEQCGKRQECLDERKAEVEQLMAWLEQKSEEPQRKAKQAGQKGEADTDYCPRRVSRMPEIFRRLRELQRPMGDQERRAVEPRARRLSELSEAQARDISSMRDFIERQRRLLGRAVTPS